jgi:hypothetical protein
VTQDILVSVPYQCGDKDCTSPGTWHKGTYWMDDTADTGYTYDALSDGDHEEVYESDLPTPDEEGAAWAAYDLWATVNRLDPLCNFIGPPPWERA